MAVPFRDILVQVDTAWKDQPALDRAVALARSDGARLHLMAVVAEAPEPARALLSDEIRQRLVQRPQDELARIRAGLEARGLDVTADVRRGRPAIALIRDVLAHGHDLVMRSHGTGANDGKRYGPVDMQLLRQCPCPVWLVRTPDGRPLKRVLATVDPAAGDPAHDELNLKVLELAGGIARAEGAALFVLHAWAPFGADLLRSYMKPAELRGYVEAVRRMARDAFADLLARAGDRLPDAQSLLVRGDAGWIIPRVARTKRVDLVVMGTVARTRISGLLIGNTAERALQGLRCSVLAIKPRTFVSPVEGREE